MAVSSRIGRLAAAKTQCTSSSGIASFSTSSSGVGWRSISRGIRRAVRATLLIISMMRVGRESRDRQVLRPWAFPYPRRLLRHHPQKAELITSDAVITAPLQPVASRSARPATARTFPGAASQIATTEAALHPAAIQNAIA